jgi:hypothetical protein
MVKVKRKMKKLSKGQEIKKISDQWLGGRLSNCFVCPAGHPRPVNWGVNFFFRPKT